MAKKLIVNADDLGRTPGVSEGILRACQEGIVTSTTVMINMPGAAAALKRVKKECPKVGLGLHLVFTAGRPLLPAKWVSSLVDAKENFLSQEAIAAEPTRINLEELRAELKSQVNTFQNAIQQLPDHFDMHHFVHLVPRLFVVYLELAKEFKIPARLPFPRDREELVYRPPLGLSIIPPDQVEKIVRENWALLKKIPVRSTDHFEHSFFGDEALTVAHMQHILDSLPNGTTEIMTHPGLADEQIRKQSRYHVQRERELAVLCDPAVKQHITDLGIKLITFAHL